MNPQMPNQPAGFNLPPPYSELSAVGPEPSTVSGSVEMDRSAAENAPLIKSSVPPTLLPLPPSFATNPLRGQTIVVPTTTSPTGVSQTQDEDLIEKEYVDRAKAIVEKTQNDPYQQSKELNFLRADFMKTNYQKQIKLSE
ncbi:MAG: hypothetical protein ABI602_04970 [Candidatus Saccharibacteria bacterium]